MNLFSINSFSVQRSFNQAINFTTSSLSKKVAAVGVLVLAALATCYLIFRSWNRKAEKAQKVSNDHMNFSTPKTASPPVKERQEALQEKVGEIIDQLIPSLPTKEEAQPAKADDKVDELLRKSRLDVLEGAIKCWQEGGEDLDESFALKFRLLTLAQGKNEDEYLGFLALMIDKVKTDNTLPVIKNAGDVFDSLSIEEFRDLTKLILRKSKDPWNLLLDFIKIYVWSDDAVDDVNKEKVNAFLNETLPTLDDEDILDELFDRVHQENKSDICTKLTLTQLDKLIKEWKPYVALCIGYLDEVFSRRTDHKELVELCAQNEIDLDYFIKYFAKLKDVPTSKLAAEVSGWSIPTLLKTWHV